MNVSTEVSTYDKKFVSNLDIDFYGYCLLYVVFFTESNIIGKTTISTSCLSF